MSQNRPLIVAMLFAVVLAGIGIGVLALTTNDTDEVLTHSGLRRNSAGATDPGPQAPEYGTETVFLGPYAQAAPSASDAFNFTFVFSYYRGNYAVVYNAGRSSCVDEAGPQRINVGESDITIAGGPVSKPAFVKFSHVDRCAGKIAVATFSERVVGGDATESRWDVRIEDRPGGGPVTARCEIVAVPGQDARQNCDVFGEGPGLLVSFDGN